MACGLHAWCHSTVAWGSHPSPVPWDTAECRCPRWLSARVGLGAVRVPAVTKDATEDVRVQACAGPWLRVPPQCARVPTSVANTWCHVSGQLCECVQGCPRHSGGLGRIPSD